METNKVKHKPSKDEGLGLLVGNKIHRNQRCDGYSLCSLRDQQGDEVLNDGRGKGDVGIL